MFNYFVGEKKLALKITVSIFLLLSLAFCLLLTFSYRYVVSIEKQIFIKEIQNVSKIIKNNGIESFKSRIIRDIIYIPHHGKDIFFKGIYEDYDMSRYDFLSIPDKTIKKIEFDGYNLIVYKINGDKGTIFLTKNITYIGKTFDIIAYIGFLVLIGLMIFVYLLSVQISKMSIAPLIKSNKRLKEYNHNIAHELKTPLSVMKSNFELFEISKSDDLIKSSKDEIELMESVIESLLFLSENYSSGQCKELQIAKFLDSTVSKNNLDKSRIKIINKTKKKKISVFYDDRLLDRLLKNLIENALKYSPKGSKIEIYICDNHFEIKNLFSGEVKNTDQLFDAFFKGDNSRTGEGYGLGLSIVKKIIDSFSWKIKINTKKDNFIVKVFFGDKVCDVELPENMKVGIYKKK